ncbi:MAG: DUF4256 domain-containing protein [Chloroherpetonaceae bacterium]|nr:DUF4256 domain-containing protein [Chloroherpetonaceae bacterium]
MSEKEKNELIQILNSRFQANPHRHPNSSFETVIHHLKKSPDKLNAVFQMEKTGGEPDAVIFPDSPNDLFIIDCAKESPLGRRSLCYDNAALKSRKENKPKHSALGLAAEMGVQLLDEMLYRKIQSLEIQNPLDTKTSSWLLTPNENPRPRRRPLCRLPLRRNFHLP